jgi:hypothetical protein
VQGAYIASISNEAELSIEEAAAVIAVTDK